MGVKSIAKGVFSVGKGLGNMALFGSEKMKNNMSKLDSYDPRHPAFGSEPDKAEKMQERLRQSKKESVKLASVIKVADKGMGQHCRGVASLIKTASGFDSALRNSLGKNLAWGAAIAAGAAGVGFGLDIVGHGILSGIHAAERHAAYKKYLKESKAKDTATERKTFNAAYHMNPHLMSNPILADAAMKQVRNYGGFDINLAGNLGKAMPGKTPEWGTITINKPYARTLTPAPYDRGGSSISHSTSSRGGGGTKTRVTLIP